MREKRGRESEREKEKVRVKGSENDLGAPFSSRHANPAPACPKKRGGPLKARHAGGSHLDLKVFKILPLVYIYVYI